MIGICEERNYFGRGMAVSSGTRSVDSLEDFFDTEDTLETALELMEAKRYEAADGLLTFALAGGDNDPDLWMAAGIARLHRGATESARCAFRMCEWLTGDPIAAELAG